MTRTASELGGHPGHAMWRAKAPIIRKRTRFLGNKRPPTMWPNVTTLYTETLNRTTLYTETRDAGRTSILPSASCRLARLSLPLFFFLSANKIVFRSRMNDEARAILTLPEMLLVATASLVEI